MSKKKEKKKKIEGLNSTKNKKKIKNFTIQIGKWETNQHRKKRFNVRKVENSKKTKTKKTGIGGNKRQWSITISTKSSFDDVITSDIRIAFCLSRPSSSLTWNSCCCRWSKSRCSWLTNCSRSVCATSCTSRNWSACRCSNCLLKNHHLLCIHLNMGAKTKQHCRDEWRSGSRKASAR